MSPTRSTPSLVDYLKGSTGNEKERAYTDLCTQIDNILNSYDDRLDAFAEMVQNSIDEILARFDSDSTYQPHLEIHINLKANTLEVIDNASGISPAHFPDVLRPNCSLKRLKRQKHARGEKGAAMVFLQFGHNDFLLESKHPDGNQSYKLAKGRKWFSELEEVIFREGDFASKEPDLPADTYNQSGTISSTLSSHAKGCRVQIEFGDGCKLEKLSDLFGGKCAVALTRLEYILKTRTAIGYITANDAPAALPEALKRLKPRLKCTNVRSETKEKDIECGFFFPHLYRGGNKSLMTDPKRNSELLYSYINKGFIQSHFPDLHDKFQRILDQYDITGYVSYAWNNNFYEERVRKHLDTVAGDSNDEALILVNAGFQVGVKDYPNGPRHNFFHRHGSEHRSRTFVVLNFRGDYKPDYGRKNVAADVKPFVLEVCKNLIAFATTRERANCMKTDTSSAPGGVINIENAREVRDNRAQELVDLGHWVDPVISPCLARPHDSENEVIAEFCHYVFTKQLPGYRLYGLDPTFHYDGMFDYSLDKSSAVEYESSRCPLGLGFGDQENISKARKWLEFKKSVDLLVTDFKKRDGDSAKKYFVLVDLLVCDKAELDEEGYTCEEIVTDEDASERRFFGVTHLLRCNTEASHVVQVIALDTLRRKLGN